MSEAERPTMRSALRWAAWAVIGLVLYVASIGPACWLVSGPVPPMAVSVMMLFYMPLILACSTTQPTSDLLQWYVNLWVENLTIGP